MARSLAELRARARAHEDEILSLHWFTPAELAARWRYESASTIYDIPAEELRFKEFGGGKLKRRRYREDWVIAYEEATGKSADADEPAHDGAAV